MIFMRNVLDKIIYKLNYSRLNILKTLLFNFRTMPFKVAIKLPVFLYGKVDIYSLKGKVEFHDCEINKGMVKMGMNKEYLGTVSGASLIVLNNNSKLIFQGPSEFSSNFLLRTGQGAHIEIGKDTFFGSSFKLVCIKKITIGEQTRIAFESQIIDSDFHFTYNLEERKVKPREREIIIGAYNWIGNRTTISKGTRTKPFTIVASSSIINRDYTKNKEEFVVLGGQPARLIANNIRRIYPLDLENKLVQLFEEEIEKIPNQLQYEIEDSFIKY